MLKPPGRLCESNTVTNYPSDADITHALVVALVDGKFPKWGMVVDPPEVSTDDYPKDRVICIEIDSTSVNVVESWISRIRRLRSNRN